MNTKLVTTWLNYHHLYYFWMVAKEGSITSASARLRLSQPTISAQLHDLEDSLQHKLLERAGRGVILTDVGKIVFEYAEEIFSLGSEMLSVISGQRSGRPIEFKVGISDAVPKLVAYRLLRPALDAIENVKIVCHEGQVPNLLAELAIHNLDLVVSDAPFDANVKVSAYNHLLGSCPISFFASSAIADRFEDGFPNSLDGAPFLMPAQGAALRRSLDGWFEKLGVQIEIKGEFDDSALIKAFGEEGRGVYAMPSILEEDLMRSFDVKCIGRTDEVQASYYAVSVERKIKHPAVIAISSSAREDIFTQSKNSSGMKKKRSK